MKPISPDCVVFYTVSQCYVYAANHLPERLPFNAKDDTFLPSIERLNELQSLLDHEYLADKKSLLIVVPNAWLSVSEHQIKHPLSKKLAPLAALAFASESTFAPPNEIFFHHHVTKLNKDLVQLHVVACSKMLMDCLSQPFQADNRCYQLISQQQWDAQSTRRFACYLLSRQGLARYQPEEDKRRETRHRWSAFVLMSALVHGLLLGYFYYLTDEQDKQRVAQRQKHTQQLVLPTQGSVFVTRFLTILRALPHDVRVSALHSEKDTASARLTLTTVRLQTLLTQWQQAQPTWHWQVSSTSPQGTSMGASEDALEVMHVELLVSAR
ncbi:MAG: hypothetical protein WBG31_04150 [Marinomonas sp.]